MTSDFLVSAEDLCVRYGARTVFEGVGFQVPRGSVFGLLGRNGAGKSSLVRCLLGLQKPTRGVAQVLGQDAWRSRRRVMERIGVVPEEPNAPPGMTARQLLAFCGSFYPNWDGAASRDRLIRLDVPIDGTFDRLSKGQKGAVMLALSLAHAPELLVLDDPTLGLDVVACRWVYDELITELSDRGTTVFITTHDLGNIEAIADRVAILHQKRLALNEPLDTLKARFRRLRCSPSEVGFSWAPFEVARAFDRAWGKEAVVTNFDEDRLGTFQARPGLAEVEVGALSLEEIFVAVAEAAGGVA